MRALYEGLDAWREVPFDWATANCCHFAKDLVERQGFRIGIEVPPVSGPEEALEWLKSEGHQSLYHLMLHLFGKPVAPLQAHRGDVLYRSDTLQGGTLGIADRVGWFLSPTGLIPVPLGQCRRAFRVPHG